MKREYIKLYCFMIGLSLVMASVIYIFTNMYKNEREKIIRDEAVIMDEIGDIYKLFTDKTEEFADKHDEYIKTIDEATTFYKVIPDHYAGLIEKTVEYEKFLEEIDDLDDYLYKMCKNKTYSSSEINKDCLLYLRNMEKVTNTFYEDIKYLNHYISDYNDWTDVENSSIIADRHYDKLEEYESKKYNKYVDLDNDGVLLGASLE